MALKFRRGNASQKSGSLSFGEPYVNTDLNTLQIGGASGDITLATTGDNASFDGLSVSASSFISASSLYVSGNIEVGGTVDGIDISTFSSSVNSILGYLNSDTSSQDVRLDNLESKSASVDISVSNINTFSASALTRLSSLEVSASTSLSTNDAQDSSITNLNSFTSSINTT